MRRSTCIQVTAMRRCGASAPFSLRLRFNDGSAKRVNLEQWLDTGVFAPLRDPREFARVIFDPVGGSIYWPNDASFAPEFLHELPAEAPATRCRSSARS